MFRCVIIVFLIMVRQSFVTAPPPLRVTIDCGSNEPDSSRNSHLHRSKSTGLGNSHLDVNSFCSFIRNALPKAIKDGKFVLVEDSDQIGFSNNQVNFAVPPPKGFVPEFKFPRFKSPKLRIPKLKVPKLRNFDGNPKTPTVGSPMSFSGFRDTGEEISSAEKMEKFKKGVQKMLHVVKVLGQIDQYLSERTRIIIDKLSKTFAD